MNPRTTVVLFVVAALLGAGLYLFERSEAPPGGADDGPRDLVFPGVDASAIDAIELTTEDGARARLVRRGEGWMLQAPVEHPADDVTIETIAGALGQMAIEGRVAGEGEPDDFGLGDGALEVVFETKGERRGFRAGDPTPVGANTYVQRLDDERIVYVQSWRVNALRKRLVDLRDRRVLEFDQATIGRLTIRWPGQQIDLERRDGAWWLIAPVLEPADERTLSNLLSDLAFMRAEGFVDEPDDAVLRSLETPVYQILIEGDSEGAPPTGLTVGGVRGGHLLARGTDGVIYRVAPERVDDLPRTVFAYRFKRIAHFDVTRARRFRLDYGAPEGASAPTHVEGELVAGRWQVTPTPMDPARAEAMITGLADLEAGAIVAEGLGDEELASLQLDPPRVHVRVDDDAGAPISELSVGLGRGERGFMVMRADSPVVYRVAGALAEIVPLSPASLEADFAPRAEAEAEAERVEDDESAVEASIREDADRADQLVPAFEE